MNVELTRPEIELLRNALYLLRESTRAQERIALAEPGDTAARDADRYGKQVRATT
jgi:hypothetical protein